MKKYVVSLDRTPQRLADFMHLNKELSVTKFPAVDGSATPRSSFVDAGWIAPDLDYSPGALGCAASHILLWKETVESGSPVLVLEDDAIAHRDLERLTNELISRLPSDWDYLALGFNMDIAMQFDLLPGVTPCQSIFSSGGLAMSGKRFKELDLHPNAYRLWLGFGTPGYVVSTAGAQKLLDKLLPLQNFSMTCAAGQMTNTGIDIALNANFAAINAYVSFPPLLITPNDKNKSTVQGRRSEETDNGSLPADAAVAS